jgi:hypothetical protein
MQQIVPALPCQLFKGNLLDDYKSATFVLAKFAVSEACWLATGLNREPSGAVAIEEITENSNGDVSAYVFQVPDPQIYQYLDLAFFI